MKRGSLMTVAVAVAMATGMASCARPVDLGAGSPDPSQQAQRSAENQRRQADEALRRWADAVARSEKDGFALVGPLGVGTLGAWEEAVGDNNKGAVMAGLVEVEGALATDPLAPARVRWRDGTTQELQPISAAQTASLIPADGRGDCPGCRPVIITGATLGTATIQTTRGEATVPAWEFTLKGTAVRLVRPAIDGRNLVTLEEPPWDATNPPDGLSIEKAQVSADGRTLTVSFTGARGPASEECGEDYAAQPVESELAVVIMIFTTRHPYVQPAPGQPARACDLIGYERAATATLANPLGPRAVLEVRTGMPVPVN